ncbi:MAG: ATP-binding cassette domain-containing protein [Patescibacteria group bacterium]|nr:ATP-binding cassette domain-containing protein [Patescibacteria group bacterium]
MNDQVILRFNKVSFEYKYDNPILNEVDFSIRRHSKITIMGQNGSGKSTIFKLITGVLHSESGKISVSPGVTIATAQQVIPREELDLTVREFFEKRFNKKIYDIDPRIDKVCEVVNLNAPHDRIVRSFSGGQQARLLLASAMIQDPDILLLDEPTNNLDKVGIAHLTKFLIDYKKTCVVISHDADFLNAFTHGVLYLDVFTHKVEQYWGNYMDVVKEISVRIERENVKNSRLAAIILANKEKANFFAHKGGQMRLVARRMREKAEELEEEMVEVRKEDKPIRDFIIPTQPDLIGEVAHISSFDTFKDHKKSARKKVISIKKGEHWLVSGPNGIGKSTLLESLVLGKTKGNIITPGVKVGYYRQDFSTLDFEETVYKTLIDAMEKRDEDYMRSVAAGFLITGEMMRAKIGNLSEGQKGLVAFAQLVLQRPGLLILDEPTNHINFRHLPVIAAALNKFAGAMILVSHIPEFVKQIRIDETLDLEK